MTITAASKEVNTSEELRTKAKGNEALFSRAEIFHQMLMEDFEFLEAARLYAGGYEPPKLSYDDVTNVEDFKEAALAHPDGLVQFDHFTHRSHDRIFKNKLNIDPDIRSLRFSSRRSRWPPIGIWGHWFLGTTFFAVVMVIIIVVNSFTIAIDQELGAGDEDLREVLETLDFFFLCLFVIEIALKWVDDFGGFWNDGWNIFDFFITATSLVAPIIDLIYPETDEEEELESIFNAVKYLRIIRIFRSLNVVTRIHKIQQIWAAVVKTFTAMIFITALMAIFFYIFAIIGIQVFDRYTHSHRANLEYRSSFVALPNAFVTLFQLFTLDHWYNILTETADVMGAWAPFVYIYMLTWILLGSFVFRNIFVGVMVNNFQNIRQNLGTDAGAKKRGRALASKLDIFGLDNLETEHINSADALVDWEAEVFHNLELIRALGEEMSPIMWPRDTMFQYYMVLESYASNVDERDHLFKLLDKALLRFLDS